MKPNGHINGFEKFRVLVGSATISHYTDPKNAPCVIGGQRLSYIDLAQRTGLPAGRSARMVSIIAQAHEASSIKDLYKKSSPSSVAVHGFGTCGLLMMFRLFESEGLDHLEWARRGSHWTDENGKDKFTNFYAYKKREQSADSRTAKTAAAGPRGKNYRKIAMRAERNLRLARPA